MNHSLICNGNRNNWIELFMLSIMMVMMIDGDDDPMLNEGLLNG